MFNLVVMFKWRKCISVVTRMKYHTLDRKQKMTVIQETEKYEKFLIKTFNIDQFKAREIIEDHSLTKIPIEQIEKNYKAFQKYNVKMTCFHESCRAIKLLPMNFEQRVLMFQEHGATTINDVALLNYARMARLTIKPFKKFVGIPPEVDIVQSFFENVFPESYKPSLPKNLNENSTFFELRAQLLILYVKWRYDFHENEEIESVLWTSLLFRNIKPINVIVEYLTNKHDWDIKKIRREAYLTRYDAANVIRFHEEIENIGSITIVEACKKMPNLMNHNPDAVKEILAYFKEMDVPDTSISTCLHVLKLPLDTIKKRMNIILNNPEYNIFRNDEKFLNLLYCFDDLERRMRLIKWLKRIKDLTAHGHCRANARAIKLILNWEFPENEKILFETIKKNKNWKHVSPQQISQSIKYLKEHYSNNDIIDNIHCILYHESVLKDTWNMVQEKYKNYEGYQFTTSQKLSLCLYHLELEHHFSGDGILDTKDFKDEQIHSRDKPNVTNQHLAEDKVMFNTVSVS